MYDAVTHSAPHFREFVDRKLSEYNLQLDWSRFVVSDNEPKMIAAFRDMCKRVGCSDHYLNKQLQHAFESTEIRVNKATIVHVNCQEAQCLFRQVKKIVSNVRRSHRQQQLPIKLQGYSETRFNGAMIMLDIFRQVFDHLPAALSGTQSMEYFALIDRQMLDDICHCLEPFGEVIEDLSEDQRPSLHRVIPLRQYLINKCEHHDDDSTAIAALKTFLGNEIDREYSSFHLGRHLFNRVSINSSSHDCPFRSLVDRIKSAWLITSEHRLATVLHPKLKNFEFCPEEKDHAMSTLRSEFDKQRSNLTTSSGNPILPSQTGTSLSVPTSSNLGKRKSKHLLSQCFDTTNNTASKAEDPHQEIADYFKCTLISSWTGADDKRGDIDILCYWKEKQFHLPVLSTLSKQVFAIPASNTVIERLFSASKNTVSDKRTSLSGEKINKLLFLQKNFSTLRELRDETSRKRTDSMSSMTTISSEGSMCTAAKQRRLDDEDSYSNSDGDVLFD